MVGSGHGGGDPEAGGWGRYVRGVTQAATQYYNQAAAAGPAEPREPGSRRRRLVQAASNAYNSYYAARGTDSDSPPEMGVATSANQELWLFPSYAREVPRRRPEQVFEQEWNPQDRLNDPDDDSVVCEVDVKGWLFCPHVGAHGRKMRWQLGVIRWMCGLSGQAPGQQDGGPTAEEAAAITTAIDQTGAAQRQESIERGGNSPGGGIARMSSWRTAAPDASQPLMTPAQFKAANEALDKRIAPFTHQPIRDQPVTVFFYDVANDTQAQARTLYTSELGHFECRAKLPFIPTHVRVLASETLSVTDEIRLHPCDGISIISDIDDTVKHSGVTMGAREMAKATFIAPSSEFIIDGVADWYKLLAGPPYNCGVHYISNSPWQLYPVLRSFFDEAGLPAGSFHLKHFTGLLQGLMEPAADKKRGSVERVIMDFPRRKWILIGDSGEADLEVYTEMAERWPDKILAICIRDVTSKNYPPSSFLDPVNGIVIPPQAPPAPPRTTAAEADDTPLQPPQPIPVASFSASNASLGTQNSPPTPQKPFALKAPPIPRKPAGLRQISAGPMDPVDRSQSSSAPPPPPPRRSTLTNSGDASGCPRAPSIPNNSSSSINFNTAVPALPKRPTTAAPVPDYVQTAAPPHPLQRVATSASVTSLPSQMMPDTPQLLAQPGPTKQEVNFARRWAVAHEKLGQRNVQLFLWRVGGDLKEVTGEMVRRELAGRGKGSGK
ncbi:Similar to Uncharacterized protein C29B5.04c; acc. no. Q9HGP1 [Pyronema omphalodes CBS 100304]|uniref:Similar to Uncharacterized protein C29B5.04c acc. no. Q9HGP1 n=1 Tax=Pyronema omphalodes (strain CBS 100304) TaxID=1076935 RepID=U4LAY0_PYROM|nr:Similar to Uncharacterized protein C29B5.04c; acc. no. Q9HGP1 [Pyronema omphalodes CBS 100304]